MSGNKEKIRFVIVGSGWRALFYVRIAKALPHLFELQTMLCRSEEKAEKIRREYDIPTTTSVDECVALKPDFVVVAVKRKVNAAVCIEWLRRGSAVLCETPLAESCAEAEEIRGLLAKGCKLTIAEQYTRYPTNRAIIELIRSGLIGETDYAFVSLAHEYHGASLIRAFLGLPYDISFRVCAREYAFATTETMNRYEKFTDGRMSAKKRALRVYEFANGKAAVYDFDSEQYHSTIRGNMLKIQGRRGEILGDTVFYLDDACEAQCSRIEIESRPVRREVPDPNMREILETTRITCAGKVLYEPPFGLCGLSEDETAIAMLMRQTGEYVRGLGENPYSFEEAYADVVMGCIAADARE